VAELVSATTVAACKNEEKLMVVDDVEKGGE
jgi:hypothetical protein